MDSKIYDRYSGYPGGRKEFTMRKLVADKGWEAVIKNAVNGMLPKNKLRDRVMKNLIIND
jgi:large subunit ribosomal protein L13